MRPKIRVMSSEFRVRNSKFEIRMFHLKSDQKYLKFPRTVILNLFQDLIHWTNRDAEPGSA